MAPWRKSRAANEYPGGSKVLLVVEVVSPGSRSNAIRKKAEQPVPHISPGVGTGMKRMAFKMAFLLPPEQTMGGNEKTT